MYTYEEIKALHIEISSFCQASCPMCARNLCGGLINPLIKESNLSFETYKKIVPIDLLKQIINISFSGNFGDPIINNDIVDIIKYSSKINPEIMIEIHTNGSIRSSSWWKKFAKILPKNHLIHFAIDGLEDTHSIYRIGTDFNKIIANARSFISEGGIARWVFITFKHNEHQIEACRKLSEELKFNSFLEKQTGRFIGAPYFDVYNKTDNVIYKLEQPTERKVDFISKKTVDNFLKIIETADISCEVEKTKSVYIDALGYLWPCCFIGSVLYQYSIPSQTVFSLHEENKKRLNKFLINFGGKEDLNLQKHSVRDIVNSRAWQTCWDDSFKNDKLLQCARTCGKFHVPLVSKDKSININEFKKSN